MADVDDADAFIAKSRDEIQQLRDFLGRQRAGGLVHDDQLRPARQRPGDLDHLLIGHAELANRSRERCFDTQAIKRRAASAMSASVRKLIRKHAYKRFLAAQHHVRLDRQMRGEIQLLIDHRDAKPKGIERLVRGEGMTPEMNLARVRVLRTGKDFHERRFARAVFADEGVDFAGADVKAHVSQRHARAEALDDVVHRKQGLGVGHLYIASGRVQRRGLAAKLFVPYWSRPSLQEATSNSANASLPRLLHFCRKSLFCVVKSGDLKWSDYSKTRCFSKVQKSSLHFAAKLGCTQIPQFYSRERSILTAHISSGWSMPSRSRPIRSVRAVSSQ